MTRKYHNQILQINPRALVRNGHRDDIKRQLNVKQPVISSTKERDDCKARNDTYYCATEQGPNPTKQRKQ